MRNHIETHLYAKRYSRPGKGLDVRFESLLSVFQYGIAEGYAERTQRRDFLPRGNIPY